MTNGEMAHEIHRTHGLNIPTETEIGRRYGLGTGRSNDVWTWAKELTVNMCGYFGRANFETVQE